MPAGDPLAYFTPEVRERLAMLAQMRQNMPTPFGGMVGVPEPTMGRARMAASGGIDPQLEKLLASIMFGGPTAPPADPNPFPQGDGRVGEPVGAAPGFMERFTPFGDVSQRGLYEPNQELRPKKRR